MADTTTLRSANSIPEKIINAKIYNADNELLGTGELTLPSFDYIKETFSGLGIAGEIESPTIGHFGSLSLGITWNTLSDQAIELLSTKGHQLNVYSSVQFADRGSNELLKKPLKLIANTRPKKLGFGKVSPGKKMDNDTELEATSIQLWIDGNELIHVDKINFICTINGVDELEEVRQHLGM